MAPAALLVFPLTLAAATAGVRPAEASGTTIASTSTAGLRLELGSHGQVTLLVDEQEWLTSNETALQINGTVYHASDGSLSLINSSSVPGTDSHGSFLGTEWVWGAGTACGERPVMATAVRVYENESVIFRQSFFCGLDLVPDPAQWLASSWPSFVSAVKGGNSVGFNRTLTFNNPFAKQVNLGDGLASCDVTTQGGVPVSLFQVDGSRVGRSLVFSQHTRMKTSEMSCGKLDNAPLAPPLGAEGSSSQVSRRKHACRVVAAAHFVQLNTSHDGYDAWVRDKAGAYLETPASYCDTSPPHAWQYVGADDFSDCDAKCKKMNCACFDHTSRPPGPPSPNPNPNSVQPGHLALGLKGTLTSIPSNFDAEWVAVLGEGIKGSFEAWGDVLLESGGKKRWGPYDDEIASSVGWWTDNGDYFHYGGTNGSVGDYAIEMRKTLAEHKQLGLPFKHWQLDSWWYLKGAGGSGSSQKMGRKYAGGNGGMFHWVADDFVFPSGGLPALQEEVKLPFVLHNRWLSPTNWYRTVAKVGGEWTECEKNKNGTGCSSDAAVLPIDLDDYWSFFFQQQKGFGLAVYEQDFLYTQYSKVSLLQTNATFADDWLRTMAHHAAAAELKLQYCMPYPREYLASTQHANVVTIRASGDYRAGGDQWMISRTSLLAHAVGLLPFKDSFYTVTSMESGGADRGSEINAQLQVIVATLSASIVAPGDGPGENMTNVTRLMGCCRSDGLVLKAERPAVPIDAVWTEAGPGGEVSFTFACSADRRAATVYLLAADVTHDYAVSPSDLQLDSEIRCASDTIDTTGTTTEYVAFDWASKSAVPFSAVKPLQLRAAAPHHKVQWSLTVVAPIVVRPPQNNAIVAAQLVPIKHTCLHHNHLLTG